MANFNIVGNIVDVVNKRIFLGTITVQNGMITSINPLPDAYSNQYILPGFIDAHVHIESSMLIPSEFGKREINPSGQEIRNRLFDCGSLAIRRGEVRKVFDCCGP
jgi:adenine deaminase